MHFDLVDLNLFRQVVDAGSITRGARKANLALGAASTRIRNLEEAIGAPPTDARIGSAVTPTQAGRALLTHARTRSCSRPSAQREDLGARFAGGASAGQIRVISRIRTRSPSSCRKR